MKTLAEINKTLKAFEKQYGLAIADAPPGGEIWLKTKLGVLSASNGSKIVAKKGTEGRATYMASLVAQICTGISEEFNFKETEWGHHNEDAARSSYEFETGFTVTRVPFIFKDETFRVGCSPDGLVSENRGAEIKCPYNTTNYIKFLVDDKIKPEWQWQNQFSMWVTGAEVWDFTNYDPRMKKAIMKRIEVERDEDMQDQLDECVPEFIAEMDAMLAKIGIKFGDQWRS